MSPAAADIPEQPSRLRPRRTALWIGTAYFLLTAVYLVFSDELASHYARNVEHFQTIETVKGVAFMLFSALVLTGVIWGLLERIQRHQEAMLATERRALAGIFAASFAHDINNLLTMALLELDRIETEPAASPAEAMAAVRRACREIVELTREMRNFGRAHLVETLQSCDLSALANEAAGMSRRHPRLEYSGLEWTPPPPIRLAGHPLLVRRMMVNLLINAADAASEPAKVILRVEQKNDRAVVTVEDNGAGISEKVKARIFDPFFTTKARGDGLGLVSVKAALDMHDGTLQVDRSELGGARFRITFPLAPMQDNGPDAR